MNKILRVFLAAASIFVPSISIASVCAGSENPSADTTLIFANGIMNNSMEARHSASVLSTTLSANGFDMSKVNIQCYFNPTDGKYDDVIELRIQAAISSKARSNDTTNTTKGYYDRLGAAYKGLINKKTSCSDFLVYTDKFLGDVTKYGTEKYENKFGGDACTRVTSGAKALANSLRKYSENGKVIVVAHSQGNFYLEAAYSILVNEGYTNIDRIQGVGVAAISQKPVGDRYVTISQDNAIYSLQAFNASVIKNLNYSPAPSNIVACANNLTCSPEIGKGQNPRVLAAITGSMQIPADIAGKLEKYGYTIPEDKRALLHEFVEVYLNEKVLNTESGKTIPSHIVNLVSDAYDVLHTEIPKLKFQDDFNGTALDSSKWIATGTGLSSVEGGFLSVAPFGAVITDKDKFVFRGKKIVVDIKFAPGVDPFPAAFISIVNAKTGSRITIGNYSGLVVSGDGDYAIPETRTGGSLSFADTYRLTVDGSNVSVERSSTVLGVPKDIINIGTKNTIEGEPFYLQIGTGGIFGMPGQASKFDWVKVTVQ